MSLLTNTIYKTRFHRGRLNDARHARVNRAFQNLLNGASDMPTDNVKGINVYGFFLKTILCSIIIEGIIIEAKAHSCLVLKHLPDGGGGVGFWTLQSYNNC